MESRRRNQLKSKGTANLKQKLKDNAERLKKENRFHQYNRNMSPGTPEAVDVPQPKLRTQPKLKISQIENRTEKLETWRLEKNRIKLQEIQDHRSPFQSVVPVGRFLEKREKPTKIVIKTPAREKLINTRKPLCKSTVTKMLQSEKAVKPTEGRNLFGTAVKVADSAYSKRLANVQCKVDSRSVKKNILGDLEPHAKAGIKKEVAKITTAKKTVQNLKAAKIVKPIVKPLLKPALKSAVKGIGQNKKVAKKVTGPAFDQELLDRTFEVISPEPAVVPFKFAIKSPQPSTSSQPDAPVVFQFNAKSTTYMLLKKAMDARKIMLTFSLNDWEKTSQDELCMNFLSVSDAKIIEKCVLEMKQMVGDLDVFGGHLESFENQTGDLSSKDLQDLWDSMQRSKEHIEEGKKIMDDILYKVLEAKNEASVVSLKKKRAKRMTKAYNLDENGEKTTPRRSTRLRKTTHSDCTGCTPSTAHKNHTPKSTLRLKKSVLFVDEGSFSTPRSNKLSRRQTGKYRRTPSAIARADSADESEPEEINLIST